MGCRRYKPYPAATISPSNDRNSLQFSIWGNFPYNEYIEFIKNILNNYLYNLSPCHPILFPFIYWFIIGLAIMGIFYTACEFYTTTFESHTQIPVRRLSAYRNREYLIISRRVRRNVRMVGSFIMLKAYFSLLLGVIMVSPTLMSIWLHTQKISYSFELLLLIINFFDENEHVTWTNVLSFSVLLLVWLCVNCVKGIFEMGIAENNYEHLGLFYFLSSNVPK